MKKTLTEIKEKFEKDDIPTAQDFSDLIDTLDETTNGAPLRKVTVATSENCELFQDTGRKPEDLNGAVIRIDASASGTDVQLINAGQPHGGMPFYIQAPEFGFTLTSTGNPINGNQSFDIPAASTTMLVNNAGGLSATVISEGYKPVVNIPFIASVNGGVAHDGVYRYSLYKNNKSGNPIVEGDHLICSLTIELPPGFPPNLALNWSSDIDCDNIAGKHVKDYIKALVSFDKVTGALELSGTHGFIVGEQVLMRTNAGNYKMPITTINGNVLTLDTSEGMNNDPGTEILHINASSIDLYSSTAADNAIKYLGFGRAPQYSIYTL